MVSQGPEWGDVMKDLFHANLHNPSGPVGGFAIETPFVETKKTIQKFYVR